MKNGPAHECAKSRLCAQGFIHQAEIDYNETFSSVIRYVSVRVLLAVATSRKFKEHQMEVTMSFLHCEVHAEIYIKQPPAF